MIALNYQALQDNHYRAGGVLVAYSLVHGGPLTTFFSPLLLNLVAGREVNVSPKDIMCDKHQGLVEQILESTNEDAFREVVDSAASLITVAGCANLTTAMSKRERLADALSHFLVIGKARSAIDQFTEGLETLGVLREVRNNPDIMKEGFLHVPVSLTAAEVSLLVEVPAENWAVPGSNRRRGEERAKSFWEDFVMEKRKVLTD